MQKLILKKTTTLEETISLLDKNGNGVLPVVDENNILLGIVTDGDIRKAILNNQLNLSEIINRNPYKMSINSSNIEKSNYLKKIKRRHLPLINTDGSFHSIYDLDSKHFNFFDNWVVIMAGGLGSRLGDLTKNNPKPMLPLDKKPILEHIINSFIHHGFSKFILCVNYKAEKIKTYFKNGESLGVKIKYIEEKQRLGTGGALSLIDFKIEHPFIVTNGDVLSSQNFDTLIQYHKNNKAEATICIRKNKNIIPYGVINFDSDNNFISLEEKPQQTFHINAGIYVFNPSVLDLIPKNIFFDLPDLFNTLNTNSSLIKCYNLSDYWIDIGNKKNYDTIKNEFSKYKKV